MELDDFEKRDFFTPFELEHILQIPLSDIVELFADVPKVAEPRGCYDGIKSRELLKKWSRRRVYADLIGRNAVNALPEIRRGEDSGSPHDIQLVDVQREHRFWVRFPGDLRLYLDDQVSKD